MVIKITLTAAVILIAGILFYFIWQPGTVLSRTGTKSYYAKGRYLVACVHGEYLGDCFIPSADVFSWLTQEQIDSIVLMETIPN